jgi:hypothetical protein
MTAPFDAFTPPPPSAVPKPLAKKGDEWAAKSEAIKVQRAASWMARASAMPKTIVSGKMAPMSRETRTAVLRSLLHRAKLANAKPALEVKAAPRPKPAGTTASGWSGLDVNWENWEAPAPPPKSTQPRKTGPGQFPTQKIGEAACKMVAAATTPLERAAANMVARFLDKSTDWQSRARYIRLMSQACKVSVEEFNGAIRDMFAHFFVHFKGMAFAEARMHVAVKYAAAMSEAESAAGAAAESSSSSGSSSSSSE